MKKKFYILLFYILGCIWSVLLFKDIQVLVSKYNIIMDSIMVIFNGIIIYYNLNTMEKE